MSRRGAPTVRMEPVRPTVRALPPLLGTALPSPREEALGLLRDIDPRCAAQVEATRVLIDVTARHEAILLHVTAGDLPARALVTKMLRYRRRVRRVFDRLVRQACAHDLE